MPANHTTIPGAIYTPDQFPVAGDTVPMGVSDASGAAGAAAPYSRSDHTHASKVRKQRVPCSASTLTWTYPTPFASGIVPIVNGFAETASGVTSLVNVQLDGAPTNTSCTFRITRYDQSVAALLGLTILSANVTPLSIFIHATAGEP